MSQRFYVDEPIGDRELVVLAGPEATHLIRVMRAKTGDRVVLFDGSGMEYVGAIAKLGRSEVELQIETRTTVDREFQGQLTLGVALPKGDRQRWLVEKLVELGVAHLVPLVAERSVARIDDKARLRLERYVIEASKQCGRNRLMSIEPPEPLASFLGRPTSQSTRWFLDLPDESRKAIQLQPLEVAFVAVGPEGGWTEAEGAAARQAGWQIVSLGARTLRVETAAVAAAAAITLGESSSADQR